MDTNPDPTQPQDPNPQSSNLSSELSHEIDEEIKRQLAEQALHPAQGEINQQLATPPSPLPDIDPSLANLKEGDSITEGWVLKRISTTSFGNNQTPFYELENASGATWTLNQEEMKSLLSQQQSSSYLQPVDMPRMDIKKEEIHSEKVDAPPQMVGETSLTDKQLSFLKKLSENKSEWQTFISLKPSQVQFLQTLYQQGQLSKLGIEANPLDDKLTDPELVNEVTIEKGDNVQSLLEKANFKLNFTSSDSPILGLHLLVNFKLIADSHKKIESSGIAVEPLPKEGEIIPLIKKANNGDQEAYTLIKDSLAFLPLDGKFKIIKVENFPALSKLL